MSEETSNQLTDGLPLTSRSLPISLIRAREVAMEPIRAMLHPTGITEQQWRILRVLSEHGAIDATSLAWRAGLLAPSVTRIVQTMSGKQLISRRNDPDDRRRQLIGLLPAGQKILDENAQQAQSIASGFRERLGDEDFEQLLDLLDRLIGDK